MLQKNQYFIAECIDYTHDGLGVCKVDGVPYFVKGMIKGEVGQLKVIKTTKKYGVARLIDLHQSSNHRFNPPCPVYKQCGGCHLQHIDLEGQRAFKTKKIVDAFTRIGHIDCPVLETVMPNQLWHYRNKVQLPCGSKEGKIITGFYKQHTNDIIETDYCYIQNEQGNQLAKRTREIINELGIKAYDKQTYKGCLRHILVKVGIHTNEMMLVLITNGKSFRKKDILVEKLTQEFSNLKTIIQNVNERHDNVILGDFERVWYGDGYIKDTLDGITFRISAKSFYQVNPLMAEKLYSRAVELAGLKGDETVIDAYCGTGTISLFLARHAKKVYGVEIVEQAINDAKINATLNNITNVEFTVGDAGEFMKQQANDNKHIDIVVVDPPRKGLSQVFMDSLLILKPKTVVYVSCDVSTQARDVAYLVENGYKCELVQGFDQFYATYHVETVCLLSRKN